MTDIIVVDGIYTFVNNPNDLNGGYRCSRLTVGGNMTNCVGRISNHGILEQAHTCTPDKDALENALINHFLVKIRRLTSYLHMSRYTK